MNLLLGVNEVLHKYPHTVATDSEHPGFHIDDLDVGIEGVVGHPGGLDEVHVVGDVHLLGVDLENYLATVLIRLGHLDEAVEPIGVEDRGVEHVEAAGRRDNANVATLVETVHLGE